MLWPKASPLDLDFVPGPSFSTKPSYVDEDPKPARNRLTRSRGRKDKLIDNEKTTATSYKKGEKSASGAGTSKK